MKIEWQKNDQEKKREKNSHQNPFVASGDNVKSHQTERKTRIWLSCKWLEVANASTLWRTRHQAQTHKLFESRKWKKKSRIRFALRFTSTAVSWARLSRIQFVSLHSSNWSRDILHFGRCHCRFAIVDDDNDDVGGGIRQRTNRRIVVPWLRWRRIIHVLLKSSRTLTHTAPNSPLFFSVASELDFVCCANDEIRLISCK